jgi:hypothetical protein
MSLFLDFHFCEEKVLVTAKASPEASDFSSFAPLGSDAGFGADRIYSTLLGLGPPTLQSGISGITSAFQEESIGVRTFPEVFGNRGNLQCRPRHRRTRDKPIGQSLLLLRNVGSSR